MGLIQPGSEDAHKAVEGVGRTASEARRTRAVNAPEPKVPSRAVQLGAHALDLLWRRLLARLGVDDGPGDGRRQARVQPAGT